MKIDVTAVVGIVLGLVAVVLGFVLEGGKAGALLESTAAIIVFGGTMGATMVSFSLAEVKRLPQFFKTAFNALEFEPTALIDQLCGWAKIAKMGDRIRGLEAAQKETPDRFLRKGLQLLADGKKLDEIQSVLETDMYAEQEVLKAGSEVFATAGGFAPTMGIAGTVMGLIHVLGELGGGAAALGHAIGLAFIATLYGVGSANLVWIPLSSNLKTKAKRVHTLREIALDGFVLMGRDGGIVPHELKPLLLAHIEAATPNAAPPEAARPVAARRTG